MRDIFVLIFIIAGVFASIGGGPFYALLFYLWNAYFRPQEWVFTGWVASLRLSYVTAVFVPVAMVLWAQPPRFSRWLVTPLLFVAACGLSTMESDYSALAQPFYFEFLRVGFIAYLISVLANDIRRVRLVMVTIAFSLGFEAIKQGFAQMILNPGAANRNPIAFLGDNNGVALGMLSLMTIFIALAQTSTGKWERIIYRVGAIGVCYRGISTYSRGAFVAAAALALFYMAYSKNRFRSLLGIAVLCGLVLPVMPTEFWDRMQTITADESDRDASANDRVHLWSVALRMAQSSPLTGVGFNSFRYAYDVFEPTAEEGQEKAPHSSWFGVLAEIGVPGLILYTLTLGQTYYLARRAKRLSRDSPIQRDVHAFATSLQGSILVVVVGGTFLHVQYAEMLWHLFGLSIALESVASTATVAAGAPQPAGHAPGPSPAMTPAMATGPKAGPWQASRER